ncbi:MAG: hypothetical protein ABI876_18070, partial [Bacteroidota bacterium]
MYLPLSGGVNFAPAFAIVDTGTAYAIKQLDESTAATTLAHAMLTLNKMENAKLDYQADGSAKLTLTQQQYGEPFTDVMNKFARPLAGSTTTTLKEYQWL